MLIILRAVTFGFLSSFSFACATWQYSHSTPNDAAINCIEGITCSAGIPLSAWIFLNSSSASFGPAGAVADLDALDCAHAPAIANNKHINVPHTASQNFAPYRFTILTLADKSTKPHAARLQDATGFCSIGRQIAVPLPENSTFSVRLRRQIAHVRARTSSCAVSNHPDDPCTSGAALAAPTHPSSRGQARSCCFLPARKCHGRKFPWCG